MVVDASAILSLVFAEPTDSWVRKQMKSHQGRLLVSTVTLAEILIVMRSRLGEDTLREESVIVNNDLSFEPPTIDHARIAAFARLKFPLNIGDCFVYALALTEGQPILTLDQDFRKCDLPVLLP
jgi:ribonuclease VapC